MNHFFRLIIERFANITDNTVVGVRAPYLRFVTQNKKIQIKIEIMRNKFKFFKFLRRLYK